MNGAGLKSRRGAGAAAGSLRRGPSGAGAGAAERAAGAGRQQGGASAGGRERAAAPGRPRHGGGEGGGHALHNPAAAARGGAAGRPGPRAQRPRGPGRRARPPRLRPPRRATLGRSTRPHPRRRPGVAHPSALSQTTMPGAQRRLLHGLAGPGAAARCPRREGGEERAGEGVAPPRRGPRSPHARGGRPARSAPAPPLPGGRARRGSAARPSGGRRAPRPRPARPPPRPPAAARAPPRAAPAPAWSPALGDGEPRAPSPALPRRPAAGRASVAPDHLARGAEGARRWSAFASRAAPALQPEPVAPRLGRGAVPASGRPRPALRSRVWEGTSTGTDHAGNPGRSVKHRGPPPLAVDSQ